MTTTKVRCWKCIYCGQLIEVRDMFVDPTDHLLDEHRAELIAEKPLILRNPR